MSRNTYYGGSSIIRTTNDITARAILTAPYAATLTTPRELSAAERQLLFEMGNEGKRREDWLAVAKQLRRTEGK
jgi:hypothetical protein